MVFNSVFSITSKSSILMDETNKKTVKKITDNVLKLEAIIAEHNAKFKRYKGLDTIQQNAVKKYDKFPPEPKCTKVLVSEQVKLLDSLSDESYNLRQKRNTFTDRFSELRDERRHKFETMEKIAEVKGL